MDISDKKKINKILDIILILAIFLLIALPVIYFCTGEQNKNVTAEEICNELKKRNSNIGKVVIYTSETDLNNLLGRPNQYISKANFADNRINQEYVEQNDAKGGTIEVFKNKEDMKKRKEYIEKISNSSSMFAEYIYSKGNVILRLEKELTPEQAKKYEESFYEIVK